MGRRLLRVGIAAVALAFLAAGVNSYNESRTARCGAYAIRVHGVPTAAQLIAQGATPPPPPADTSGYEFGDSPPTTTAAPATTAKTADPQILARCDSVIAASLGAERTRWYVFGAFAVIVFGAAALGRRPQPLASP